MDLALTPYVAGQRSTDLDLTNGAASTVDGDAEVGQRIRLTLQAAFAESNSKRNGGTPWREVIFAEGATVVGIRATLTRVVENVTGVDVATLDVEKSIAGAVTVAGTATTTTGGSVTFGGTFEGSA